MVNIEIRQRRCWRRHARTGVVAAFAAVASLAFAAPAAAVPLPPLSLPSTQSTPPSGTASITTAVAPPTGRTGSVQWSPGNVNWGTETPHEWVLQVTPPQGATLTDNSCTGSLADGGGLAMNCSFTGSIDGSYTVTITAKAGSLLSANSATATIAVQKTENTPGIPQNLKALRGPNELVVSWQPPADPGDGVTGYHAEAVPSVNPQADAGHCDTTQLTCTIKGLDPNTAYDVWVFSNGKTDHNPEPAKLTNIKPLGPATSTPTPPASVPSSAGKLAAPSSALTTGKSVTLSGTGYAPDSPVQIVVYSTPQVLKTVTTDSTGSFSTTVALPAGLSGSHTLVAGGVGTDGVYRYLTLPVTVTSTGGTGGGLPVTGASVPKLVGAALLVLAFGAMLVRVTRRRKA